MGSFIEGVLDFLEDVVDGIWSVVTFLFDLIWDTIDSFVSFVSNALGKLVKGAVGIFVALLPWGKVKHTVPPEAASALEDKIKVILKNGGAYSPESFAAAASKFKVEIQGQYTPSGDVIRVDNLGTPVMKEPVRNLMRQNEDLMLVGKH